MPDHPLEQLGPVRFQELCQALAAREYPNVQCFPIGQPDGGRDALVRGEDGEMLVLQVKFSRSKDYLADPAKWITEILASERPKIDRLTARGATRYRLITNIPGTGHLESGAIDKVQRALDALPIPADCWWRDDLNRRLDGAFDVKLSYPEVLTAGDILRILAERGGSSDEAMRRQRAIKTYLVDQYEMDREVRFKQADLANELLKFFIDVPAESIGGGGEAQRVAKIISKLRRLEEEVNPEISSAHGGASLILDSEFQDFYPRVIVEGAPGQGKSTMLQYVCQVHRYRILDREETRELRQVHRESPIRLPFKVDLRRFAEWLTLTYADDLPRYQEPSEAETEGEQPEVYDERVKAVSGSLERFVAEEIERNSGGVVFDVNDLLTVIEESSVLLALDGLDEAGDSHSRELVGIAIGAAVMRLREISPSFQVVLTMRPSGFVGAAPRGLGSFAAVRLAALTRGLISDYTEKWMDARKVPRREQEELTSTLDRKLEEPHFRDISQNPMQLAILLDLVQRRGESLPDQRTTLYLNYMELFLDREATKSPAVRRHRKLLVTLHGYLAWLLHSRAESSEEAARFTTKEVKEAVGAFLRGSGNPEDLFGDLFAGVFDRVGALISRTPGTFEFEVQPLREFFAARYLYETAPYSAVGEPKPGNRPERFDAIARRPFWLNVARFFAGSYDVGELGSLADRLTRLNDDPGWSLTAHPRLVASRLLADRTFEQDRHVEARVIALLEHHLATRGHGGGDGEVGSRDLVLPLDSGGGPLAERAWQELRIERLEDRRTALAEFLALQVPDAKTRQQRWATELPALSGEDQLAWYRLAPDLGLGEVPPTELSLTKGLKKEDLARALLEGGQLGAFDEDDDLASSAVDHLLCDPGVLSRKSRQKHILAMFSDLLKMDASLPSFTLRKELAGLSGTDLPGASPSYSDVVMFCQGANEVLSDSSADWRDIEPWDRVIERGRSLFRDRDALTDLAVLHTTLTWGGERKRAADELLDSSLSLCHRVQLARANAGDARWWGTRLDEADSDDQMVMILALAWIWGHEQVLASNLDQIVACQASLGELSKGRLATLVARSLRVRKGNNGGPPIRRTHWLGNMDALTFLCASQRMPESIVTRLYRAKGPFPDERCIGLFGDLASLEFEVLENPDPRRRMSRDQPESWQRLASLMRHRLEVYGWTPSDGRTRSNQDSYGGMSYSVAESIVREAEHYPVQLVTLAETCCMQGVERRLEAVLDVSERDQWFSG